MTRRSHVLWLLALLAGGIVLHAPLRDAMNLIAQGDHGLSFYCFKKTLDGQLPYRDYFWNYGPLMPFYYAACFKFLGVSMPSVLAGQLLLKLLSGVAVFSAVTVFFPPTAGFLAAVWFWLLNPDFFYRFDQAGAILALLTAAWILLRHFRGPRDRLVFALPAVLLAACLIKLNIGLAALAAVVLSLAIDDLRAGRRFRESANVYQALVIGVPALTTLAYAWLLTGLPDYRFRQCLPFTRSYDPSAAAFPETLRMLLVWVLTAASADFGSRVAAFLFLWCLCGFFSGSRPGKPAQVSSLIALALLTAFSLHEFLLSGVEYRILWATPSFILMMFFPLGAECQHPGRFARLKRLLLYGVVLFLLIPGFQNRARLQTAKDPANFFAHPRARIHLLQQTPDWKETVGAATAFLEANLRPGETFLALPYEPIYYFLTGRDSPTWEILFFKFMNMPESEEDEILSRLEKGKIRLILMSNRVQSVEPGLGYFGVTHCGKLSRYIDSHYTPVASFGNWDAPAGWAWNHAVKILARKG